MSRSSMQISNELKEKLESIKVESGASSLGEVIEGLIQDNKNLEEKIEQERKQRAMDRGRVENEYIHTGENFKNELIRLSDDMRLSESQLVEFLLHNYDGLNHVSKMGFAKYVELRK